MDNSKIDNNNNIINDDDDDDVCKNLNADLKNKPNDENESNDENEENKENIEYIINEEGEEIKNTSDKQLIYGNGDLNLNFLNTITKQIFDEMFKTGNNIMQPNSFGFDIKIENFDSEGKKYEKNIHSSNGQIFYDIQKKDQFDESSLSNNLINNDKDTKNDNNDKLAPPCNIKLNLNDKLNKVDYASSIGDIQYLNEWLILNIDSENKFIGLQEDYSTESLDMASSNGKINILDWWKNTHLKYNIELKYTKKAINLASKNDKIDVLNWWINSNLELKYSYDAIDYASAECKLTTLDWWLKGMNDKKLNFEYSTDAIDNFRLDKNKLNKLVNWWKNTIKTNKDIKFKYTRKFIDYLETCEYIDIYNFLVKNDMINKNDKFNLIPKKINLIPNNSKNDEDMSKFFELFGIKPVIVKQKDGSNSKYNIDSFPEDIKMHIKEKEEELNNNMLINGKAKEYIDNLIKIPFGKYKFEKIFCFIGDLINKINSINQLSSNENIKKYKIVNESDLIKFLNFIKVFPDNTYYKYNIFYNMFIKCRTKYIEYVDKILNETVYGHFSTKKQIKCIISQWLSGGFKLGIVIGIQGPPGVGKTTIIKEALSKCLIDFIDYDLESEQPFIKMIDIDMEKELLNPRPFCFTSLGGTTNGSTLSGHNITYHGSTSGDIVKHLKNAGIMNPILYFDELDKISKTEYGSEIASVLTHITDPAQNSHFTDRYFAEVKIDLSKAIIVFSYNESNKIDRILLDRIQEIKLNPIKPQEKLIICNKFIIPEICSQLGYNIDDITINNNIINNIINDYTMEAGVRKLKEKIFEVFRMNHLDLITNSEKNKNNNKIISEQFIFNVFADYPKINHKKIEQTNMIGCINGMFASTLGLGGITPIQVRQIYLKETFGINITGSIEKVMEESVKVAKTVAWNLLTTEEQNIIIQNWDSRGFHIHFPDGSTSKDGPSAGTAITCAIYSLLTGKPIVYNIAITGEIDLNGNVTQIGGLDAKLNGAKNAGVKLALVPKENQRELNIVIKNNPKLINKNFKVYTISNILDVFKYIFK